MSKKDKALQLKDYQKRFVRGARRRGVDEARIEAVWEMMMSFSGYSFCKPHSASYARVSFQAAYLKTHFPAEFMAAVISNRGGFYSTFAYVSEARRMGLRILPPDVNRSELRWKGKTAALRVGLSSVFGLGRNTGRKIVAERKAGPYRNLLDLLTRVKPEEPEARSLIQAGAFDSLHPGENRAALLWELALWQKTGSRAVNLFSGSHTTEKPVFPPDDEKKRLREAYAALGFLCDRHPMTLFAATLRNRGIVKARDLPRYIGKQVRIAGLLITGKVVHTRQGEPMEFLTFEDETGLVETTFFPRIYRRFCNILDKSRPFILSGKVEEDFGAVTLTVQRAEAISKIGGGVLRPGHTGIARSPLCL
jgi:DNA polymerase-3 subunit alpha/error-prone DNA polymerase